MYFMYKNNKIYYKKFGYGKVPLLILPGWGDVYNTFSFIIDYFKEYFSIYYVYYPGFGKSKELNQEFTIYDYADSILFLLEKEKIKKPIILAHSFGGRIVSLLIGKYKVKCLKLILIDVAGIKHFSLKVFCKKYIYKFLKMIRFLLPCCLREIYLVKIFKYFSSSDYLNIPSCMRKTFQNIVSLDLRKYYKQIKCDTLIIWGSNDKDTPLDDAYYLNKIISNSGLIVYKNSGHFSYYEKSYETIKILYSYLKK